MITSRIVLVAAVCAMASGCGGSGGISAPSTVAVSGSVMYKGKPVVGVKVTFHPQFDMGAVKFTPSGETGKDGRFTLSTAAPMDGAPPGEQLARCADLDLRGPSRLLDARRGKSLANLSRTGPETGRVRP